MTINEAIEYYDSLAEECRQKASIERNDYMDLRDESAEYSQLSDWLAELAVLREKVNYSELPNSSGDLISRQDALSLLNEVPYLKEHPNTAIVWEEWIKSLPSVQAQQMIPTQMSGTSNYSPKFKPGDKFLLEIGEKRIGLDEYSIVGTDLYVWGSLLEKLTPYEPTVQAEQKKGHWIPVDDPSITGRCSVCGFESHLCEDDVYGYDYCPNCGARLEVVDE